ncbi:DNA-directed RNA polymerase subunit alpha [Candidatus Peregrinibacteria bacterium]|nr:DNA-directed RNA polymerase subunit alpha [Candidatus Peregrinibacteria bacterium]
MHQIQEEIGIPKIEKRKISDSHMIFIVSPLPPGYGTTIGNAFRRVLLSSLPGASVTAVKIDGISHEYSTIKGIKDSILDIILNLKQLNVKKTNKEISFLTLNIRKEGVVTAKDIKTPSDVEILNPDLYITTADSSNVKFNMQIRVEKGVGYIPVAQRQEKEQDSEFILVDAIFSPIEKVRYDVEATRVGQMTNLDKLILEIVTNGSITPDDALKFSANILKSYFSLFNMEELAVEADFMSDIQKISAKQTKNDDSKPKQENYTPIEILGLSPRTLNACLNGDIGSIEQLVKCSENKLNNLRGFGKKALTEVKSALKSRGLALSEEKSKE